MANGLNTGYIATCQHCGTFRPIRTHTVEKARDALARMGWGTANSRWYCAVCLREMRKLHHETEQMSPSA